MSAGGKWLLDAQGRRRLTAEGKWELSFPTGTRTLLKWSSDGALQWTHQWWAWGYILCVVVDGEENVYLSGHVAPPTLSNVKKLNSNGELLWEYSTGVTNARALAIDGAGNVYVAGDRGTAGSVHKLNAAGELLKTFDTGAQANCIALDVDGNVYVGGRTGNDNNALWKLDPDLNLIWGFSNATYDRIACLIVGDDGVYVQSLSGTWKVSHAGNLIWSYLTPASFYGFVLRGPYLYVGYRNILEAPTRDASQVRRFSAATGEFLDGWGCWGRGLREIAVPSDGHFYASGTLTLWKPYYPDPTSTSLVKHHLPPPPPPGEDFEEWPLLWALALGMWAGGLAVGEDGCVFFAGYKGDPDPQRCLCKLNSAGQVLWSRNTGDEHTGVILDSHGNAYSWLKILYQG